MSGIMETVSSDLVTFLRARLDEDEQVALGATSGGPWREVEMSIRGQTRRNLTDTLVVSHTWPQESAHIVRHDPVRVLREAEAKRALVADLEAQKHVLDDREWYGCQAVTEDPSGDADLPPVPTGRPCTCGRDEDVKRRLGLLATVWSDHSDYRAEWAP